MTVYAYDLTEILPRISGPIREILDAELKLGNSIQEMSMRWPMKQANVWLTKRFHGDYQSAYPNLRYTYLGDPKNWIEEYVDSEREILLAVCGSARI
ncbi:MAG: hypothetical protein U1F55_05740 [Chitinivorax sp.]|jgi:hypothetical protein